MNAKKVKIHPRNKWICVEPDKEESRILESGLTKPDNTEQERKSIGTVVSVGSEVKDLKKGDRVIYGTYAGERLELEKENLEFYILHDDDIVAIIEGL